jgi:hypothetical protein
LGSLGLVPGEYSRRRSADEYRVSGARGGYYRESRHWGGTMATAVGDPIRLVRIGRHGHCGQYEQTLSGGGWVRVRSLCVHLNPDSSAANMLGGHSTGGRPHEDSLVDCPRRDCAHGRQRPCDHEQCLQEQPSRMVCSNVRYPAPREDWAQLIAAPRTAPKRCGGSTDGRICGMRYPTRPTREGFRIA